MDRLTEIEERWANPADKNSQPHVDIAWLIAEVKRLREENAKLRVFGPQGQEFCMFCWCTPPHKPGCPYDK